MSDQLFITEHDDVYLPSEFHFSHNLAVTLYDDLVWILKDPKTQRKVNVNIKFKEGEKQPKENDKDIIQWLISNGREKEANEIISKNITFALISDICHFIFQALDSAKGIKMSVAYSLIRKPFLENLIIMEQLLSDEKLFLKRFGGKPEDFDPGRLNDEEKKALIKSCISKLKSEFMLHEEVIFELRFNKKHGASFYSTSNLATHLVTTRHAGFKTVSNDFNFVFSTPEDWEDQLQYFYYFVPYVLFYAVEIIDQYLLEKKILTLKEARKRKFKRMVGQMQHFDMHNDKNYIGKLAKLLKVKCKKCNKSNQLFKSDLFSLTHNGYILCKHCLYDLFSETNSMDQIVKTYPK